MRLTLPVLLALFCALVAVDAEARPFRVDQLPNAPASCNTCHTSGGGTPRNSFGLDVESTLVSNDVDWAAVCNLDSDDDGFTNGEELGDPDCVWTTSDGPLETAATRPGDANSFPGAEPVDSGADSEGGEDGGCQAIPTSLFAALGVAALLRRRRR